MQLSTVSAASVAFDDPALVSSAGLVPVTALASRCDMQEMAGAALTVPSPNAAGFAVGCRPHGALGPVRLGLGRGRFRSGTFRGFLRSAIRAKTWLGEVTIPAGEWYRFWAGQRTESEQSGSEGPCRDLGLLDQRPAHRGRQRRAWRGPLLHGPRQHPAVRTRNLPSGQFEGELRRRRTSLDHTDDGERGLHAEQHRRRVGQHRGHLIDSIGHTRGLAARAL